MCTRWVGTAVAGSRVSRSSPTVMHPFSRSKLLGVSCMFKASLASCPVSEHSTALFFSTAACELHGADGCGSISTPPLGDTSAAYGVHTPSQLPSWPCAKTLSCQRELASHCCRRYFSSSSISSSPASMSSCWKAARSASDASTRAMSGEDASIHVSQASSHPM
eukprot:6205185-Pleurochrysis_carterae.AAC.7